MLCALATFAFVARPLASSDAEVQSVSESAVVEQHASTERSEQHHQLSSQTEPSEREASTSRTHINHVESDTVIVNVTRSPSAGATRSDKQETGMTGDGVNVSSVDSESISEDGVNDSGRVSDAASRAAHGAQDGFISLEEWKSQVIHNIEQVAASAKIQQALERQGDASEDFEDEEDDGVDDEEDDDAHEHDDGGIGSSRELEVQPTLPVQPHSKGSMAAELEMVGVLEYSRPGVCLLLFPFTRFMCDEVDRSDMPCCVEARHVNSGRDDLPLGAVPVIGLCFVSDDDRHPVEEFLSPYTQTSSAARELSPSDPFAGVEITNPAPVENSTWSTRNLRSQQESRKENASVSDISPDRKPSGATKSTPKVELAAASTRDGAAEEKKRRSRGSKKEKERDYANVDSGARVLASSDGATGAKNIIVSDDEKYMLAPCDSPRFIVIELSEDIILRSVVVQNFEVFSSFATSVIILSSQNYPTSRWSLLKVFEVSDQKKRHQFSVAEANAIARYVKIVFVGYNQPEYYCTVTQVSVHGKRLIDDWRETFDRDSESHSAEKQAKKQSHSQPPVQAPAQQADNKRYDALDSASEIVTGAVKQRPVDRRHDRQDAPPSGAHPDQVTGAQRPQAGDAPRMEHNAKAKPVLRSQETAKPINASFGGVAMYADTLEQDERFGGKQVGVDKEKTHATSSNFQGFGDSQAGNGNVPKSARHVGDHDTQNEEDKELSSKAPAPAESRDVHSTPEGSAPAMMSSEDIRMLALIASDALGAQQQEESVFRKVTRAIRTLELNQSLTNRYIDMQAGRLFQAILELRAETERTRSELASVTILVHESLDQIKLMGEQVGARQRIHEFILLALSCVGLAVAALWKRASMPKRKASGSEIFTQPSHVTSTVSGAR
ncbi:protein SLP1 [Porphyridium purpureum]|uniref:Protein SLP1 n=1 Tax=Porphyridium purpureum TaxID=35688 RepID=A0A5J4YHR2_PORPP|nr:protein SLP1 [Porphyridium purpureum]|eukprot:POR7291..scf251_18